MTSEYIDSKNPSWHTPRKIQADALKYRNTIQLLAKTAIEPGQEKHYYFVYTNNDGKQYYLAGYPQGSFPNFGSIVRKTGEYKSGTPDFKDSIRVGFIQSNAGKPQEVYTTFQNLQSAMQVIEDQRTPYRPLHENSNAAAISALYGVNGIQFSPKSLPTPSGREDIKAPGQDIQLIPLGLISTPLPRTKSEDKDKSAELDGASSPQSSTGKANLKEVLARREQIRASSAIQQTTEQSRTGNADLDQALAMLDQMNGEGTSTATQQMAKQSSTGNDDLDQALAMLDQMNKEEAASFPPEKTVTTNRNRGREIGE
jgi:hypothetical protein